MSQFNSYQSTLETFLASSIFYSNRSWLLLPTFVMFCLCSLLSRYQASPWVRQLATYCRLLSLQFLQYHHCRRPNCLWYQTCLQYHRYLSLQTCPQPRCHRCQTLRFHLCLPCPQFLRLHFLQCQPILQFQLFQLRCLQFLSSHRHLQTRHYERGHLLFLWVSSLCFQSCS